MKTVRYNYAEYKILKYFSYTTVVMDRIYESGHVFESELDRTGEDVKEVFEKCCEIARKESGINWHWNDNKCCFKLQHIESGKTIFIGQYDGEYSVGLSCRITFGHIIDFDKGETSEWYPEDYKRKYEY